MMNEPSATVVALGLGAVVGLLASLVHVPRVRFETLATTLLGAVASGLGHSLAAGLGSTGFVDAGVSLVTAVTLLALATSRGVFRGNDSIR
jgi:hypothetical protein